MKRKMITMRVVKDRMVSWRQGNGKDVVYIDVMKPVISEEMGR